jgi:hypothetical protein
MKKLSVFFSDLKMAEEIEWIGGKPTGCINIQDTLCQVVFSKLPSKCFTYKHYESKEKAIEAAELYRRTISDAHGLTKNKYRYVEDEKSRWLEVKLQGDLTFKCEVEHLPFVEERIWTGNKSKDKYTYYVKSRESKKRDQDHCLFHKRVYTEFKEVDHINRDGLDNRSVNIREGSGRVNPNNKKISKNNKSGVKGVFQTENSWCAQWNDVNGKKRQKTFSISKYGEKAFTMACDYRKTQHELSLGTVFKDNT